MCISCYYSKHLQLSGASPTLQSNCSNSSLYNTIPYYTIPYTQDHLIPCHILPDHTIPYLQDLTISHHVISYCPHSKHLQLSPASSKLQSNRCNAISYHARPRPTILQDHTIPYHLVKHQAPQMLLRLHQITI